MKRSLLPLSLAIFLLSACGGTPADNELQKMHDAMVSKAMENARFIEKPEKSKTTMNVSVHAEPIKNLLTSPADLTVDLVANSDMSSEKNPLVDLALKVVYGSTPKVRSVEGPTEVAVNLALRIVSRTLSFNISKADYAGSAVPQPFSIPAEMATRWYGITFDEANKALAEQAKQSGQPVTTIEETIAQSMGGAKVTPAALKKLWSNMHLWKGVELLPETDGLVRIRVESDKEKIKESVRSFVQYVKEASGPSWERQMQNPAFAGQIQELIGPNPEYLKKVGAAKGIISADKATYEFRGFDGDFYSESGALVGHLTVAFQNGANFSVTMIESETKEELSFVMKNSEFVMTLNDKKIATGKITATRVDITVMSEDTGKTEAVIGFDVKEASKTRFSLENGVIDIPADKVSVSVPTFLVELSGAKLDTLKVLVSAAYKTNGVPSLKADLSILREPLTSVSVEKPVFVPFDQLQTDVMSSLMMMQQ